MKASRKTLSLSEFLTKDISVAKKPPSKSSGSEQRIPEFNEQFVIEPNGNAPSSPPASPTRTALPVHFEKLKDEPSSVKAPSRKNSLKAFDFDHSSEIDGILQDINTVVRHYSLFESFDGDETAFVRSMRR